MYYKSRRIRTIFFVFKQCVTLNSRINRIKLCGSVWGLSASANAIIPEWCIIQYRLTGVLYATSNKRTRGPSPKHCERRDYICVETIHSTGPGTHSRIPYIYMYIDNDVSTPHTCHHRSAAGGLWWSLESHQSETYCLAIWLYSTIDNMWLMKESRHVCHVYCPD